MTWMTRATLRLQIDDGSYPIDFYEFWLKLAYLAGNGHVELMMR